MEVFDNDLANFLQFSPTANHLEVKSFSTSVVFRPGRLSTMTNVATASPSAVDCWVINGAVLDASLRSTFSSLKTTPASNSFIFGPFFRSRSHRVSISWRGECFITTCRHVAFTWRLCHAPFRWIYFTPLRPDYKAMLKEALTACFTWRLSRPVLTLMWSECFFYSGGPNCIAHTPRAAASHSP